MRVTADAASDTVAVYEASQARDATVAIPPARTANISGHGPRSPARDRTITLVKQLGRRRWKKVSGYHRQGRVENAFFRYKSIIGDGLRARSPARLGSEIVLGCEILNRMTALGRPVSYRIGRWGSRRWASCGPVTIRATTPRLTRKERHRQGRRKKTGDEAFELVASFFSRLGFGGRALFGTAITAFTASLKLANASAPSSMSAKRVFICLLRLSARRTSRKSLQPEPSLRIQPEVASDVVDQDSFVNQSHE